MKNITRYLLFVLFISCIFISKVNAECSYQERKDLLNAAKGVDIAYEIKTDVVEEEGVNTTTGEVEKYKNEYYSFDFSVTNLSDNIFIKYYNDFKSEDAEYINKEDLINGIYNFNDSNTLNIYKYYFEVYSLNSKCPGYLIYTHKVTKPMYNYYSDFSICKKDGMENYEECNKFITKELGKKESTFISDATSYYNKNHHKEEKEEKSNSFSNLIKKYWYCFILAIIVILAGIVIIVRIIKRRGELN